MIKINYYHSLIFFNLCIFLSAFEYLRSNSLLIVSLLLILSIGISHGSLDHLKGKKLLKILGIKSSAVFYLGYVFVGLATIFIWLLFPKFLLFLFLIVAAFHFGKEDSRFISKNKNFELIYFLKGSLVIVAPLLFHKNETLSIFKYLNFDISTNILISNEILYLFVFLSFISNMILTLNKDGALIQGGSQNNWKTEKLPSLCKLAKDPAGCGDAFFITSSMAMSCGSSLWEAAYLGSIAAGLQAQFLGNTPVSLSRIKKEINNI